MTPAPDKVSCSCLRNYVADKTLSFSKVEIADKILDMFAEVRFENLESPDIKFFYVAATNQLTRQTDKFIAMSPEEKAATELRFNKRFARCTGCMPQDMLMIVCHRQASLLEAA